MATYRAQSVGRKFVAATLPLIVAIMSALGFGVYATLRNQILALQTELGRTVLENSIHTFDRWTAEQIATLQEAAAGIDLAPLRAADSDTARTSALATLRERLVTLRNDVRSIEFAALYADAADRPLFIVGDLPEEFRRQGLLPISDVGEARPVIDEVFAGAADEALLPITVPVPGGGSLAVGVRLDEVLDYYVMQDSLGVTTYLFILSQNGAMIAHPDTSLVLTELGRETAAPWYQSAVEGVTRFQRRFRDEVNLYILDTFQPAYADGVWYIYFRKGLRDALMDARRIIWVLAVSVIVVSIGMVGILTLISRRVVVQPVNAIGSQLHLIAEGQGDLTLRLDVRSRDEIGTISTTFNRFLMSLQGMVQRVVETSRDNLRIRDELAIATIQSTSDVNQIVANIDSIDRIMTKLGIHVVEADRSTEEIRSNIDVLMRESAHQAEAVAESTASVEYMVEALKNVADITATRSQAATELSKDIRESGRLLSEAHSANQAVTDAIGSIVEMTRTISRIASQTNELAMDAAIEASQAGGAGRRFSVVAAEIRALAEHSNASSTSVSTKAEAIVKQIQTSGRNTAKLQHHLAGIIDEMQAVAVAFREIEQSTAEISAGSDQVLKAMVTMNELSFQVADAAKEMTLGAQRAGDNMRNVSDLTSTAAGAIQQINAGSNDILATMRRLQGLATNLSEHAEELSEEVGRFVV